MQNKVATEILGFTLGPQGFLYTNMLVLATRNAHIGAHAYAKQVPQCKGVCVLVEYIGLTSHAWYEGIPFITASQLKEIRYFAYSS